MKLELTFNPMKALKVYRWIDTNSACPPAQNGSRQCEHVCAARSVAELSRISGLSRRRDGGAGRDLLEGRALAGQARTEAVATHRVQQRHDEIGLI